MATNAGNVTITVTLDDSLRARVINLLERAKHEHYGECPAESKTLPLPCECGAKELNAEIDAMIAELTATPKAKGGIVYA
jgi:hypothetical protein